MSGAKPARLASISRAEQVAEPGRFHPGELAIQTEAGVRDAAARLGQHMLNATLRPEQVEFIAGATHVVTAHLDKQGLPRAGLIAASRPGLATLMPEENTLSLQLDKNWTTGRYPGVNASLGLLFIDFKRRRRLRVNGRVVRNDNKSLRISINQAYGNCPRYIHQRQWPHFPDKINGHVQTGKSLSERDRELIKRSDTFFLATSSDTNPATRGRSPVWGSDASHRGGERGFLREEGDRLVFSDFPGNNLFNSLGNLRLYPYCGILIVDFEHSGLLQLSGRVTMNRVAGRTGIGIEPWLVRRTLIETLPG